MSFFRFLENAKFWKSVKFMQSQNLKKYDGHALGNVFLNKMTLVPSKSVKNYGLSEAPKKPHFQPPIILLFSVFSPYRKKFRTKCEKNWDLGVSKGKNKRVKSRKRWSQNIDGRPWNWYYPLKDPFPGDSLLASFFSRFIFFSNNEDRYRNETYIRWKRRNLRF